MAERRRHVFVEKVLQRLFPNVSSGHKKREPQAPAIEDLPKTVSSEKVRQRHIRPSTENNTQILPGRRLYTVSLPPEGYMPSEPGPSSDPNSENISSGDDTEDQGPHDQPKRRRIRKHKSKKNLKNPNNVHVEQAGLEKQQSPLQEKLQPQHTDGSIISKNKKRKLKKKQQIKKKKAAGLVAKASGVNFMYQPEESSSEQEDVGDDGEEGIDADEEDTRDAREGDVRDTREGDVRDINEENIRDANEEDARDTGEGYVRNTSEEDVRDAREGNVRDTSEEEDITDANEEKVTDTDEEDVKITNEKADSILNFLKSTQEIYFYDGVSRDSSPAICVEATEELLSHLASHRMSPSDVFILDHMKTLLLVQDIERLKSALDMFPEHCMMPREHARVISAFFNYWITHILPERNSE
ncbi:glutamate-rich protein 1 [Carlito syrichta]|uniref:Glutamate-rich protein 1 n=1 Tax=Carlito syrichta TaxID=1868482 RepID=A0A1U7TA63_CARSF|nr:glutamate-rich protein 1 [Carlito syrichta]